MAPTKQPNGVSFDDEHPEHKKNAARECCKKFTKFMFSHIGLCGIVIAYAVAGGFIFKHLEQTNEKMECEKKLEKYTPAENDTVNKLWRIATSYKNALDQGMAMDEFRTVIQSFRDVALDLSYDGSNCSAYGETGGPQYQWSFCGALLFSVTVITTIGYGNIAPKTFWGRLVCIAYAVLGIPLMLLCLANLGEALADVFKFVYTKICCCGWCKRKDKNKVQSVSARNENSAEAWKEQYGAKGAAANSAPTEVDVDEEDDEDEEDESISVPLTITMVIIGSYIFLGAVLFGAWEGWDALKASYFCFVTISTIGFGDIVPGADNFQTTAGQWKMVGAAVYIVFGMAIISMCFNLIQEEIVAKFKWIGEKLGIVQKEEEEDTAMEGEERDLSGTAALNAQMGYTTTANPRATALVASTKQTGLPTTHETSPSAKKKL